MAMTKTEPKFIHTCDGCGVKHESTSSSRPSGWARLIFEQAAQDFQGNECADATVKRDFCPPCRSAIIDIINKGCGTLS